MKKMMTFFLFLLSWTMAVHAEGIRADVIKVTAGKGAAGYHFSVTLKSNETGCAQYADWWEVLDGKGALLYRRILFHSHPDDQPFTRSGGAVRLDPDQTLYVRGHMNRLGYTGDIFTGSIAKGFKKVEKAPLFPRSLETQKPLPDGCAF